MSQVLFENGGLIVSRFWGGALREVCYQITNSDGVYVQLTEKEFYTLFDVMFFILHGKVD